MRKFQHVAVFACTIALLSTGLSADETGDTTGKNNQSSKGDAGSGLERDASNVDDLVSQWRATHPEPRQPDREGYFDSAGARLYYAIHDPDPSGAITIIEDETHEPEREAKTVLLIHGFTADAEINWTLPGVTDALRAAGFRVVLYDQRGHGRSQMSDDPEFYGLPMMEDAIRLLDHLELDRVCLAGYSMGGMIATRLLVEHPERFTRAVIGGMGWVRANDDTGRRSRYNPSRFERKALWACFVEFWQFGITEEQLRKIEAPTALVIAQHDLLIRIAGVDPLHRIRPDIPLTVIPDVNHITCVADPAFAEAVVQFLSEDPDA